MALLTFRGVVLHYDPASLSLTASEHIKIFPAPPTETVVQALGAQPRALSCTGRYARPDAFALYNRLRPLVGKTGGTLSCEADSFPAVLRELVVCGSPDGVGLLLKLSFIESMGEVAA